MEKVEYKNVAFTVWDAAATCFCIHVKQVPCSAVVLKLFGALFGAEAAATCFCIVCVADIRG